MMNFLRRGKGKLVFGGKKKKKKKTNLVKGGEGY